MTITIARPIMADVKELDAFFHETIEDAYVNNQFPVALAEAVELECKDKLQLLREDIASSGKRQFFLIAKHEERTVGTAVIRDTTSFVKEHTPRKYRKWKTIGAVFVKPNYQRKGIGRQLLNAALIALTAQRQEGFLLDCGYPASQKYWVSLLGQPSRVLSKFWYNSIDHYFWARSIGDCRIELRW